MRSEMEKRLPALIIINIFESLDRISINNFYWKFPSYARWMVCAMALPCEIHTFCWKIHIFRQQFSHIAVVKVEQTHETRNHDQSKGSSRLISGTSATVNLICEMSAEILCYTQPGRMTPTKY